MTLLYSALLCQRSPPTPRAQRSLSHLHDLTHTEGDNEISWPLKQNNGSGRCRRFTHADCKYCWLLWFDLTLSLSGSLTLRLRTASGESWLQTWRLLTSQLTKHSMYMRQPWSSLKADSPPSTLLCVSNMLVGWYDSCWIKSIKETSTQPLSPVYACRCGA